MSLPAGRQPRRALFQESIDADTDQPVPRPGLSPRGYLKSLVLQNDQPWDTAQLLQARDEILNGLSTVLQRGLSHSALWLGQLLKNVNTRLEDEGMGTKLAPSVSHQPECFADYSVGKGCIETQQFLRAMDFLKGPGNCDVCCFLNDYAELLSVEKGIADARETESGMIHDSKYLPLKERLYTIARSGKADGWQLYLLGSVLSRMGLFDEAKKYLCEALRLIPMNWSAWVELSKTTHSIDEFVALTEGTSVHTLPKGTRSDPPAKLPNHWMVSFFAMEALVNLQRSEEALEIIQVVLDNFNDLPFALSCAARAKYHLREHEEAVPLFESIRRSDPHRLEDADIYSNILYVKRETTSLNALAKNAIAIDRYRPETCCIIGNYFSLMGDHEKAVVYFQRALRLDRNYLSAWTLMGHEYLELRSTTAAINAYRSAVEVDPNDYRAWHGLGQTYELLDLPHYACYYYRKAVFLRPYDARMWCGLATTYENMQKRDQAIQCFERAVSNGESQGIAIARLAELYNDQGDSRKAAYYHSLCLNHKEMTVGHFDEENVPSLHYLAEFFYSEEEWEKAELYCSLLLSFRGPEVARANDLLVLISGHLNQE
eukprot:Clim_evm14s39 gene=Clim_evmTU14s39